MPSAKTETGLTDRQVDDAKALQRRGYTFSEIADLLQVDPFDVVDALYWAKVESRSARPIVEPVRRPYAGK